MARAQGARSQLAAAFETTYGTAPATGFSRLPFASETLGSEQPLLENELLGYGRDPLAPIKDVVTTSGSIVVPIDVAAFGFWLKGAFGDPVTVDGPPAVHTFQSGAWDLPSLSIEKAMPEVPYFPMFTGAVVDKLSWTMARGGQLTATVDLIAQGETPATVSNAGSVADIPVQRFGNFNGQIKRGGTVLANLITADIAYGNNLDPVEVIRADGKIDGVDPSMAMLSGRLTSRFADTVLIDQATAGDPCELVFAYSLSASAKFTFTAHAVYLPKPKVTIDGPKGVQVTFDWQAAMADVPGRMCTAVLTNTVEGY
ncbi:phage tail tube protein [Loktanella sp. M215]|uniref:phage tail tube protein n=1 Tax=Loktanella sp. M215 TaxID=2675431 RepID=UPI001F30E87C|nr:phage tail tube protein [Loktanella sp. M215]MCF7700551.1 hypothetical protein [Loktanella sp. M215]